MPPRGFSWRDERDWDVHNAEKWLQSSLPAQLSSETLNGRKASKKKYARTMELKHRLFTSAIPARLPLAVAQRLSPLFSSLSSPRHLVGVQDEPFDYEGMDPDDEESDDIPIREVILSSFSLTGERVGYKSTGEKLNVVFLRNTTRYMCSSGAVVLTCQFDADRVVKEDGGKKKKPSKKEQESIKTLIRVGVSEDYKNTWASEDKIKQVMARLGFGKDGDPTAAHFMALLLSLCYHVADGGSDLKSAVEAARGSTAFGRFQLRNADLFRDIIFFCSDQRERYRLSSVFAFLSGHNSRLGQASKISCLPDLPLQMIAKKFLALPWSYQDEKDAGLCIIHNKHFLGLP